MNSKLMQASLGVVKADLAIINGKMVNVYTKEIYEGGVAVIDDKICATGDVSHCIDESTKIIDAKGLYLTPGFIDGHIHPESSSLNIRNFAEIVMLHGTTMIMTDLHEIGCVAGVEAIEAMLDEAADLPLEIKFMSPSHIPFSPGLETCGGHLDNSMVKELLKREDAVGLSEIVGPYVLMGSEDLLKSMDHTLNAGKSLQGHLPEIKGPAMQACVAAGISTDHESLSTEDAVERARNGLHVMMREGSAARNLADCLKAVTEHGQDPSMFSIITDDLHTIDAVDKGHLDASVRTAMENGIDFATAIQMVSLNAARAFNLDRSYGSLSVGRRADINITTAPEDFKVVSVIAGGKLIVENNQLIERFAPVTHKDILLNTVTLKKPVTAADFTIKTDNTAATTAHVLAMKTLPFIPITLPEEADLKVENGVIQADVEQDIIYIAQVERYGKNGNIGNAFMAGFGLKQGAIACSIGHDNHNIVVLGTSHPDMAVAVNRLAEIGGGQLVVNEGKVISEIEFPIGGLLSDLDAWTLADQKKEMLVHTKKMGCFIPIPFMFLSFICLAAIPSFAVTDHGFIDVMKQEVINPVLSTN